MGTDMEFNEMEEFVKKHLGVEIYRTVRLIDIYNYIRLQEEKDTYVTQEFLSEYRDREKMRRIKQIIEKD